MADIEPIPRLVALMTSQNALHPEERTDFDGHDRHRRFFTVCHGTDETGVISMGSDSTRRPRRAQMGINTAQIGEAHADFAGRRSARIAFR
jgi:hypothetical protein